jgi:hypothetical protein
MEATVEKPRSQFKSERAAEVAAEAVDAVAESTIHRTADAFARGVDFFVSSIVDRRAIPETVVFADGRAEAIDVAEVGFRNGRTAGLRARPGTGAGPDTIEGAAMDVETNARQYDGHVPDEIYGRADRGGLRACYERSVRAGVRSVRRTPFGEDGPTAYDTPDRGFNVDELLRDRLRIQPELDGRRAYDAAVPASFVESVRALALEDTHVASHFVYSYASGSGVPLPYTVTGVELMRAHSAKFGTRYEEPDRVARLVRM